MQQTLFGEPLSRGVVYFFLGADGVKIGYTERPTEIRKKELQTGNPNALILLGFVPGDKTREKELQATFASFKTDGGGEDWFRADPALMFAIRLLLEEEAARRNAFAAGVELGRKIEWQAQAFALFNFNAPPSPPVVPFDYVARLLQFLKCISPEVARAAGGFLQSLYQQAM